MLRGNNMTSLVEKKRILYLDYLRAFCMLWIIGFWHMADYCRFSLAESALANNVTVGVLSTFTYISAFFLGRYEITSWNDALAFYKKRLLRIYPLFLISCLSFWILHLINPSVAFITDAKQLILTLVGMSCVFTPAPLTIWYVSMLILLYTVTPIFNAIGNTLYKTLALLAFSVIFYFLSIVGIKVDDRLLYLIPAYCFGLVLSKISVNSFSKKIKILILSLAGGVFLVFTYGLNSTEFEIIYNIIIAFSFLFFVLCSFDLSETMIYKLKIGLVLQKISYASFCAYLFHRQLFGCVKLIIGRFNIAVAYLIILPVTFLIMYLIQKMYDIVIEIIKKRGVI